MTALHEAAQKALELNLEELKQIATLWKNFRIGNMGDYPKQTVELLKLQSQYHAAAAPDVVLELIRQIESLRSALAQQGEPVVHHHGFSKTNQHLRAINESLDKQLDEVMRERDHREEIINQLCDAVLGPDRYEWSSMHFFEDAVREVEERMAALAQQGEAVAWLHAKTNQVFTSEPPPTLKASCTPLYAGAAPATKAQQKLVAPIPQDFHTHKQAWLTALQIARDHAKVSLPDVDDKSYWKHEIHVFQRAYAELEEVPVPHPETSNLAVWDCKQCGAQVYTRAASKANINDLACGRCGSHELHKAPSR